MNSLMAIGQRGRRRTVPHHAITDESRPKKCAAVVPNVSNWKAHHPFTLLREKILRPITRRIGILLGDIGIMTVVLLQRLKRLGKRSRRFRSPDFSTEDNF